MDGTTIKYNIFGLKYDLSLMALTYGMSIGVFRINSWTDDNYDVNFNFFSPFQ